MNRLIAWVATALVLALLMPTLAGIATEALPALAMALVVLGVLRLALS